MEYMYETQVIMQLLWFCVWIACVSNKKLWHKLWYPLADVMCLVKFGCRSTESNYCFRTLFTFFSFCASLIQATAVAADAAAIK